MKEKLKNVNWVKVLGIGTMVLGVIVDVVDNLVEHKKMETKISEEVAKQLGERFSGD